MNILSFIPNFAGLLTGVLSLVHWVLHWHFIPKINKLLIIAN
jgi:hypothetical protein